MPGDAGKFCLARALQRGFRHCVDHLTHDVGWRVDLRVADHGGMFAGNAGTELDRGLCRADDRAVGRSSRQFRRAGGRNYADICRVREAVVGRRTIIGGGVATDISCASVAAEVAAGVAT
ncbi:MAG: hypothetical protein C5B60_03475 [Chloroflexi bacterium]|nr:MAG: hypothetical protein C5B60_03475 [Chloroflexota bacterium]